MFLTSPITFPNLGITVDPNPVAFTLFGKEIYWYGIIIATGFLLAALYMMYRAKTFGLTQDDVLDVILWVVPIGVVCARLYYCLFYWELYRDNPISMLYIWEGGLAIYGGIIGGAITILLLSKIKRIPTLVMLDDAAMGVLIGQIMGRWGNFMNREAHGAVTDSFFKMGLTDAFGTVTYYHPTFLYESVWNLVGFLALHFYCKKRKFDGEVFLLYCAAILRHMSQPPPGLSSVLYVAGMFWLPIEEFSTQPPFVMNTRSFSVRSMPSSFPSWIISIRFAIFLPSRQSKSTFVTCVLKWNCTPKLSRYLTIGKIIDSYWLYFVKRSALKSGRPPMWWI